MARPVFLITSSLRGLRPVEGPEGALLAHHATLMDRLRAVAPALEPLFAEPFIARTPDGLPADVSWYTLHDGPSRRFGQVQPTQRAALLRRMQQHVDTVHALGDHPDAAILRAMLSLSGPEALMAVGDEPVLIDWGVVPQDSAADLSTGAARAASVLTALGLTVPWTPATAGEAPAEETATENPEAAPELAPSPEEAEAATSDISDPPAEPSPDDAQPAAHDVAAAAVPLAASTATVTADAAPVPPVGGDMPPGIEDPGPTTTPEPWYRRAWVGVLLALAILALLLAVLWWLLLAPGGLLARPFDQRAAQLAILDSLAAERDRLTDLLAQGCGEAVQDFATDGLYTAPLPPVAAVPPRDGGLDIGPAEGAGDPTAALPSPDPATTADGDTPAAPTDTAPESPPAPETPRARAAGLARDLEDSVALVFGSTRDGGVGMGSGFFIAPDLLVTNRHVIADMSPNGVLVTSESIGTPIAARVEALTRDDEIGRPDFALLRLASAPPRARPLAIAAQVDKLARVVTAGYPAFITGTDPQFIALMEGDASAAPSMIFTSGEVSVVQTQFNGPPIIIHTADMSQGNSGGPLVDGCGRVVGVNTFISEDESSGRRGLYSLGGSALGAFLTTHGAPFQSANGACAE